MSKNAHNFPIGVYIIEQKKERLMKNAADIIATALVNYINDSAGAGSEEAKEIEEAWKTLKNSTASVVEYMEDEEKKHYDLTMFEDYGEEVDAKKIDLEDLHRDHVYYHLRVLKGE